MKQNVLVLNCLLVFASIACDANRNSSPSVYNGTVTEQYPAVVNIKQIVSSGGSYSCTGTFIGPRTLITAAHCVEKSNTVHWNNEVANKIEYPASYNYNDPFSRDDLALVEFDSDIAPAIMSLSQKITILNELAEEPVTFVGFGRPVLGVKTVGQNKINSDDCGMLLTAKNAEAKPKEAHSPQILSGDSGGPLLRNDELIGLTSAGKMKLSASPDPMVRTQEDISYQSIFTDLQLKENVDFICRRDENGAYAGIDFPSKPAFCEKHSAAEARVFEDATCRKREITTP